MFLIPESKSTHRQCSQAMATLLIVIHTLSHRYDYLCLSNVPRACQQYCDEPLSGGGDRGQRAAIWDTSSVQKITGSVIWGISRRAYVQPEHRGCDGNRSAGHRFCFGLSTGMLSLDSE